VEAGRGEGLTVLKHDLLGPVLKAGLHGPNNALTEIPACVSYLLEFFASHFATQFVRPQGSADRIYLCK
jgi:hypothetical protein